MIRRYSDAKAERTSNGREILPAGGYVCKILDARVDSTEWGDRLVISFDIDEGDRVGFFKADYDNNPNDDRKWRGVMRLKIPEDDGTERDGWKKRSFNNFIWALEDSNRGFLFDWDESKLKGKTIGILFREREWEYNGRTGWSTEACSTVSADDVRGGNFRKPKPKALNKPATATQTAPVYAQADSDDCPF